MRKASPVVAAALAGTVFGAGLTAGVVHADLLGSVLKGAGIAFLVKQFQRPLNDGINKLTGDAGAPQTQATKVVPIVSIGQGGYVGAAQVSGPGVQVDQVQAVGQLEGSVQGRTFRLKALVPINTERPSGKTLTRVKGVGVSAIVDIHV
ncbi:MAG: hypothetical protein JO250_19085 [Armatimonadetes bacterium]|nr:hypothetical protein [Armatimonadota bacterium]